MNRKQNEFNSSIDLEYLGIAAILNYAKDNMKKINADALIINIYNLYHIKQNKHAPFILAKINNNILKKKLSKTKKHISFRVGRCEWCETQTSPKWRSGPSGQCTLCNSCGLQWGKGRDKEYAKRTIRKPRGIWKKK